MRADYSVVLDTCVLMPMPLCDTLLRMAESPRLYLPKWSDKILEELSRNLVKSLNLTPQQAAHREAEMKKAFPEACVEGYEPLIESMTNDPKDRHVLAAAIRSKSELIVTYNKRDFPKESLSPWSIEVRGPSTFLKDLYDLEPGIVSQKLNDQASNLGISMETLLLKLRTNVPGFVDFFSQAIGLDLPLPGSTT